jgi:hypothetical protein
LDGSASLKRLNLSHSAGMDTIHKIKKVKLEILGWQIIVDSKMSKNDKEEVKICCIDVKGNTSGSSVFQ